MSVAKEIVSNAILVMMCGAALRAKCVVVLRGNASNLLFKASIYSPILYLGLKIVLRLNYS
jgi:hypothetical protein